MGLTLEERKASGGPKPRAMRVGAALEYSGLSRSAFYRFAAEGRIELLKVGRTTLAVTDSLDALLDGLPRASLRAPRKQQADAASTTRPRLRARERSAAPSTRA